MSKKELETLFVDIANAIRVDTTEPKFNPLDFPAKIAEALAASSGGNGDYLPEFKFTKGKFEATEGIMTIEHGMGIVPDIIVVHSSYTYVPVTINSAFGFSTAAIEAFGEGCQGFAKVSAAGGQIVSIGVYKGFDDNSLPTSSGCIQAVNANTFTIGSSTFPLDYVERTTEYGTSRSSYYWYAYGGITGSSSAYDSINELLDTINGEVV